MWNEEWNEDYWEWQDIDEEDEEYQSLEFHTSSDEDSDAESGDCREAGVSLANQGTATATREQMREEVMLRQTLMKAWMVKLLKRSRRHLP